MVLAARSRVGVAIALLGPLGMFTFGPTPAYAATIAPTVTLTGQLIQLADQTGPAVAAVRTADKQLVPVAASVVKNLKPGSAVTLNVVVPAAVRSVAAANRTLTVRGPNGRTTSTPLDAQDLAAASDGTPEPATSDLGRATVASAVSTGQALAVSAVVSAADPVSSFTPATRHLFVAIVTPKDWPTPNAVTQAQIQTQVDAASNYWSTVSGGGVTLDVAAIAPPYRSSYNCADPDSMFNEAISQTGFNFDANTSVVLELPAGIFKDATSNCSYGLGTIGGNVNDYGALYVSDNVFPVLAHELGHNMSLQHANTLECPSASDSAFDDDTSWTGASCREADYGDGQDVMSASLRDRAPFLSAPQSLRAGIIPASAARVISNDGTTTVTLNALGSRIGVRAAEVVDPTNNVTYYVEYRVTTAPDTANVRGPGYALGVRVLRFNLETGTTVLLDPTPPSTPVGDHDATLHVGGTFSSYGGAVLVSTVSITPTTATISITRTVGRFTAVSPVRVMDTRKGVNPTKVGPGAQVTLTIPGLPAGTTAVALNVTVTNPTAPSYLTVYPTGQGRPTASNLNFVAGQTIPNMVIAQVGPGNKVTFYNAAGTVDVLADLAGYYVADSGAGYTSGIPTRVMDTRTGPVPAKVGAGAPVTLTVPGLPAGTTAVALNVTVTNPTAPSYLTVYPAGQGRPTASQLNFVAGQTIPNMVIAQVGPGNMVTFYNSAGTVDVLADLAGYYALGPAPGTQH